MSQTTCVKIGNERKEKKVYKLKHEKYNHKLSIKSEVAHLVVTCKPECVELYICTRYLDVAKGVG